MANKKLASQSVQAGDESHSHSKPKWKHAKDERLVKRKTIEYNKATDVAHDGLETGPVKKRRKKETSRPFSVETNLRHQQSSESAAKPSKIDKQSEKVKKAKKDKKNKKTKKFKEKDKKNKKSKKSKESDDDGGEGGMHSDKATDGSVTEKKQKERKAKKRHRKHETVNTHTEQPQSAESDTSKDHEVVDETAEATFTSEAPPLGCVWNPNTKLSLETWPQSSHQKNVSTTSRVDPNLEIYRQKAVNRLQYQLETDCRNNRIRFNNVFFENWIFNCERASKSNQCASEGIAPDPVIPSQPTADGLVADLVGAGMQKTVAQGVARKLCAAAARETERMARTTAETSARARSVDCVEVVITGKKAREALLERATTDLRAFDLTYNQMTVRINKAHHDKLRLLHSRNAPQSERGDDSALNSRVFSLLVRYHTLQGGHVQGGGMQAALIEDTFDALLRNFGVNFECFASPLNSRYGQYCSMFADTDGPFGSVGSFFDFYPLSGSFEANPPFEDGVIHRMAMHIDVLLDRSDRENKPLSFVVVIPAWAESSGWQRLNQSTHLKRLLTLSQRDHGFCEGTQHSRPTRYRISTYVVPIVVGLAMTGDFFAYWVISAVMVGMVLSLVRLFMEFLNFVILAIRHVRENWRRLLVVRFKPVPLSEVVKSYAFFAYEHKLLIEKRVTSWIFTYRLQKAFRYFGGSYWALSILIVIQFVFVGLFEDSQGWIFLCTINYLVIYVLIWRKAAPWSEVAALAETEEDSQSTGDANNKTTEVPQTSAENLSAKPSRLARMASRVAGQDRYSTDLEGCEYIYRFIPDYHVRNRKTWLSLLLPILFISQSIWLCVASVEHQGGVAFIVAYLTVFYGLFWGLFYCFIMALWLKSRKVVRIVERREIAAEYVRIIKAMNEYLIYILMFVSFIGVVCGIVYLTILAEGTFLDGFLLFLAVFLLFSVISTITTKAFRRAYPMEAFWFLFILFVTVGVVLSVFSYSLQQNDDNNDTSEPISLVSAPIAPSPTSFASCDVTFGPTAMSIMDMAYMSKVAYAPMEVVQRELNTWFNANQTDGTGWYIHYNATTDGYPYFYDIRHNTTGMAIISVRGTNSLYDVVMDMDLWLEIAVLQMTDFFLPTLSLWPVGMSL
ncbi:hypothetical protein SARC_06218, partial [Sphaeroforma arctica JP610]